LPPGHSHRAYSMFSKLLQLLSDILVLDFTNPRQTDPGLQGVYT